MKEKQELVELLRDLYNISGFRVSLHDTDFKEIVCYPPEASKLCQAVQRTPTGMDACRQCDAAAFATTQRTQELYIYHCHCGLYEAVSPLYDFGVLSGYLMMGQMIDTYDDTRMKVSHLSSRFVPEQALPDLLDQIPTATKEKIISYVRIMRICAEYITLTNRMNFGSRNLADEVKRYIGKNYAEKISIDLLSRRFLTSKSTLMHGFKSRFGTTINDYLTEVRIEHAKSLLAHTDRPIQEIAETCGFANQNYFAKVFLKINQTTPTAYRRSCLTEASAE